MNDTCGHAAGDQLLKQVASVLRSQVRESDTIARLGGDEFAAILYNCSLDSALGAAQDLLTSIQNFRFVWCDKSFTIGVSIGVVPCHPHQDSLADLMKAADTACYTAKNQGRNQVYVVQDTQQTLAQQSREMNWIARIHQALETDQFCLFYQNIAPLQPKQETGEHYEVLIRLRDTDGSLIPPMAFVPTAERYGLMRRIDRWVIHTLFETQGRHYRQQHRRGQAQTNNRATYAINLSGETLNDEQFIEFLQTELHRYQIPPQVLCFEITETAAISNLHRAKVLIEQLRNLGCRFALDDFGVGMSSFSYLKHLPVDYIKIDGAFVKNLLSNSVDAAVVKAIGQIAYAMGIATIAEFVEDEQVSRNYDPWALTTDKGMA
ncbi:MAG: EAL domain-containing protein [Leptolyngbyaceae cyanobacterium MO_188.B28]|nr:EAL domain-containing protein [Leptolyngbyaceae cyanobacterium MO_188.B28]